VSAFAAPHIEYALLSPLLIVFGGALLGILIEAFVPRSRRYVVQVLIAVLTLGAGFVATIWVSTDVTATRSGTAIGQVVAEGAIAIDGPTLFIWGTLLLLSFVSLMLFAERAVRGGVSAFVGQGATIPGSTAEAETESLEQTEIYPLMLFSLAGMMMFPAANDLLTMFVGLEILSLPLYLMTALARRRRLLSQEAALKYFLLGAFSSGFFVYGMSLVYGYAASLHLSDISQAISMRIGDEALLLGGIGLMAVAMLFKIGAAPFHSWTPDVYQGAPTPVTAFMAACTKVAAFGALTRLFYVAFGAARWDWTPLIWGVAILTMAVGAVLALTQSDIKRMLAYSSIAHAGFLLVGFVGLYASATNPDQLSSVQAVLFYLVTYGFMTVGAFGVITMVRDSSGEANQISRWAGLGKRSPWVAGAFAFFLLGMAGIPLTSGFTGKWAVFASAAQGGAWPLVIVAVLLSAVAAFFYVRVIVVMFFSAPVEDGPTIELPSPLTVITVAIGVAVTLVLGVWPAPVLELAGNVGQFIR
jgi:NADH-quinone oxidoreductase subunit N